MAGKLEIRVVPKEQTAQRPQTLSPLKQQNSHHEQNGIGDSSNNQDGKQTDQPPIIKLERTKSILKQSSKERGDNQDLHSPKREQITFAPDLEKHLAEKESKKTVEKRVSLEGEPQKPSSKPTSPEKPKVIPVVQNNIQNVTKQQHEESESSEDEESSDEEEEDDDDEDDDNKKDKDLKITKDSPRRISLSSSNSRINFEPIEALKEQKLKAPKPIDKFKKNLVDSKSESSSSTQEKFEPKNHIDKPHQPTKPSEKTVKNSLKTPDTHSKGQCSPSIDLTSNPAVTFVSAHDQR